VDSAPTARAENGAAEFSVRVASTGLLLPIPRDLSIVEVLREAGIKCNTSCEAGLCGTCRTRYFEGTPEHNDFVLDDTERESFVMICCARASSEVLVLDL
jgi:ferredoxin